MIFPGLCAPTAPVTAEVRPVGGTPGQHHYRTTPKPTPHIPDEYLSYLDTFPADRESIPPPF
ncbi:hypothetical protein [Mycobacterium sp. AZCC_0083]|uniref:hypothetical protein n=1 Tax=Mycobacterium sp. AZCC_0083 TaxID=2735882 RepID=UPI00161DA14E|nr:hypothetical protein [Mycobacterium sp. AZCC_0083]MBB5161894.1 hypothetical protein [Mycobacterium sp. AZCC_0083]